MVGIQSKSLPELGDRFVEVIAVEQSRTYIGTDFDVTRLQLQYFLVQVDCLRIVLLIEVHVAQFSERFDVFRIVFEFSFQLLEPCRIERRWRRLFRPRAGHGSRWTKAFHWNRYCTYDVRSPLFRPCIKGAKTDDETHQ